MPKFIKLPFRLLIYDIETSLLLAYLFSLGEQTVRHSQLLAAFNEFEIICIAAKWYGEKKVYIFQGENAVEEFDKLARQADVCLGKNSDRFDVKRINTERMMKGLKPYPEWMDSSEDLEKQCRKYFAFPSQSLDYLSNIFGTGGKEKMEFSDWVSIKNYKIVQDLELDGVKVNSSLTNSLFKMGYTQVVDLGKKALKKMIHYNKKDVTDTEAALIKVLPYIKLKHNASTANDGTGCTTCGSKNIVATKVIVKGKTKYQQFDCLDHKGYAGKATWYYKKDAHRRTYSKMG